MQVGMREYNTAYTHIVSKKERRTKKSEFNSPFLYRGDKGKRKHEGMGYPENKIMSKSPFS